MPWGFAAAGAASGIAGAAASSAGGKKGSKQSRQSEALSREQANTARTARQMAVEQYSLTAPLRLKTFDTLNNFLNSGATPSFLDTPANVTSGMGAFQRTADLANLGIPSQELQLGQTRNRLINQGSRGGLLSQQLAQANLFTGAQRADAMMNFGRDDRLRQENILMNDILRQETRDVDRARLRQSLFGAASDLGVGGVTQTQQGLNQAMSGLGGAASNLNSLGSQQIMQQMQTQQALGNLAGKGLGYSAGQMLPAYGQGTLGAQKSGARPTGGGLNLQGGR